MQIYRHLSNLYLDIDALGTTDDKRVATKIYLDDCTFKDQRISSIGNSIPTATEHLSIAVTDTSNLLFIPFSSLKYLKIFILAYKNIEQYFPKIENDLSTSDETNFYNVIIDSNEIPSFLNMKIQNLELSLKIYNTIPSFDNLDTLESVDSFNFIFNGEIEYPNALGSPNNKIRVLDLKGLFSPPSQALTLPSDIEEFTISNSPSFNNKGLFPFASLSNILTKISIGNLGLTKYPMDLIPPTVKTIILYQNNIGSPLPDIEKFYKLSSFSLTNSKMIGSIPENYCKLDFLLLENNNLEGEWNQCFACYQEHYSDSSFSGNPKLIKNDCKPGSIVPYITYNQDNYILSLRGKNLGIDTPVIKENLSIKLETIVPQSHFEVFWDPRVYGVLPNIINVMLGNHEFILATSPLVPEILSITKSGNQFVFKGIQFSYDLDDIIIKISGVKCSNTYIDFNTLNCQFSATDQLKIGQDIPSTIQNIKLTTISMFTVNTAQDKTTIIKTCSSCNEGSGNGLCSSTTGKCICSQYYTGESCNLPNQFLTSASSALSSGGLVNLYGWFGSPNEGLTITIGSLNCQIHYYNTTFANCTIGAGSGTKSIKIIQNNQEWIGENMFHYTETTYRCPKDCSLNGVANGECNSSSGQCKCFIGWGGYDCNSKSTTGGSTSTSSGSSTPTPTKSPEIEIPESNTTINNGSSSISNQQTTYEISILSLIEYDVTDAIVITHNLTNKWISIGDTDKNIHKFNQNISETCRITYIIEDIKESRDYEFAGLQLTLEKDSIKITVNIENYPFTSVLNKLQLRLESIVGDNGANIENNQCNNKETSINKDLLDNNQLLNYITISKNEKVLYGRFINRVLSDHRQSFITTSLISNTTTTSANKESFIIGLNLPFFTESLSIDPDFSVLVSPSFKKCKSNDRAKWVLPVAIVVPCVAVATIIIISAIIYKKNRTTVLLVKNKFKLRALPKKE
ncbi:hypothetical protein DICPUDRAFT_155266 [Dictyostelium purpureum]|uniref:EGF-like domain-containing protein n=1 Tax=Dictyostelium purpureum TaxID=5786 RepID=F0ZTI5_DICPU|nr:uncharacterized protein DICPUDRAFT_155266 [Dictyostelium purpureum]EGC32731.1 hypothetical protein DICPUDRAFT_155266 [Dictyostelium purpureum]|eukprot:XP_003290729.1 hypothetical protein DICPUDRAFT_155266 [Dictyostelium purpureum]